jgi:hypothetical protein
LEKNNADLIQHFQSVKRLKLATEKRNFGRYRCIKSQNYRILQGKRKLTPSDSITEQIAAYENRTIIHCFISLTVFSQEQKTKIVWFYGGGAVLFILEF